MKKLLATVFSLVLLNVVFAHTVTPQCWLNKRYTLKVTDVSNHTSVKVTVGNWDTTINIHSSSFTFSVPQANLNIPVLVKFKFSDNYSTQTWTNKVTCAILPLKYKDFKVKYLGNRTLHIEFTLYEVSNVKQINIMVGTDGLTYKPIAVILPDNLTEYVPYSINVKY